MCSFPIQRPCSRQRLYITTQAAEWISEINFSFKSLLVSVSCRAFGKGCCNLQVFQNKPARKLQPQASGLIGVEAGFYTGFPELHFHWAQDRMGRGLKEHISMEWEHTYIYPHSFLSLCALCIMTVILLKWFSVTVITFQTETQYYGAAQSSSKWLLSV